MLGNGELEGTLGVTGPDDVICLSFLGMPLDVEENSSDAAFADFLDFCSFFMGRKLIFTLMQHRKNPNLFFTTCTANLMCCYI